jgi:Tfp pilus assembly protein PilN
MIQFNLLPDVKIEYLKARRNKRLVVGGSMLIIAASLFVLILLAGIIYGVQKKNLNDLNGDIGRYTKQLKDTPDLNKILTVQNQLGSLTGLHNKKAVATRLFNYLTQVTPTAASISQLNVDFAQNTISITGSANSLDIVNTYADTLKFTKFKESGSSEEGTNAFTKVVLSQFSRTTSGATYTVTASFDPLIFDSVSTVSLDVPHIISTRSATEQPTDLFQTPEGQ